MAGQHTQPTAACTVSQYTGIRQASWHQEPRHHRQLVLVQHDLEKPSPSANKLLPYPLQGQRIAMLCRILTMRCLLRQGLTQRIVMAVTAGFCAASKTLHEAPGIQAEGDYP